MSVLIKGMKIPKSCASCRFNGSYCYAKGDENAHSILPCPLIPVPDHGDLIDRNVLRDEVKKHATPSDAWVLSFIRTAQTIIPADKEKQR